MKEIISRLKYLLVSILFLGLSEPLFAQEKIIKDFAEERRDRKFCLYPSTLRMINLSNNEAYNAMVKDIDKLLIYKLDSATHASKEYLKLMEYYALADFEEYITMYGGSSTIYVYGKEGKKNQITGVFAGKDGSLAFYLKGNVAWEKIPTLINTLNSNDMLNLLELNSF